MIRPLEILPRLVAKITGTPRYKPDIEWSNNSWVHNIFRAHELLLWRKQGIRAESKTQIIDGRVYYELYTFEAYCAFIETMVRQALKWRPIKIVGLRLATNPYGYAVPMASFAIALDANTNATGSGTSPLVWSILILVLIVS